MKTFFSVFKNSRGATFIEVLVGSALMFISGTAMVALFLTTSKSLSAVSMKTQKTNEYSNIIETIRLNVDFMQVHYDSTSAYLYNVMDKDNMPWAIADDKLVPVADCPQCRVRMGYVIQPSVAIRGLYNVRVKIFQVDLNKVSEEYSFIVSSK